jgi:hypothetical protein
MAIRPLALKAMVEHQAEYLGEVSAAVVAEAREARARARAERERAARAVAASRQAWEKRYHGGLSRTSAVSEPEASGTESPRSRLG